MQKILHNYHRLQDAVIDTVFEISYLRKEIVAPTPARRPRRGGMRQNGAGPPEPKE